MLQSYWYFRVTTHQFSRFVHRSVVIAGWLTLLDLSVELAVDRGRTWIFSYNDLQCHIPGQCRLMPSTCVVPRSNVLKVGGSVFASKANAGQRRRLWSFMTVCDLEIWPFGPEGIVTAARIKVEMYATVSDCHLICCQVILHRYTLCGSVV